jgi:hypothetical protein
MATISNTPRPGYIWDATDNVWYPIGVGAHQHTNAADTPAVMPYSTYAAAGKNKILNGDFGVNQRGFTSTGTSEFHFDRWQGYGTGTTFSAQTFTPGAAPVSGYEGRNFYRTAVTGQSAAGDYVLNRQFIEDVRTLAGQTVTLSFWAKAASGTPNIGINLYQYFGTGGSPSSTVEVNGIAQAVTTSWARYSYTFNIPSISGKTIGTNNNHYLALRMWLSAGSTYNTLSGTTGNQTNTFDIWGVQLEAGSTATAFQTATGNPASELAACQRYYYRQTSLNNNYENFGLGMSNGTTTAAIIPINLPVTMRTAPTSVDYSTLRLSDFASGNSVTSLTIDGNHNGRSSAVVNAGVASGLTAYRSYALQSNNSTSGYIGFSAEL